MQTRRDQEAFLKKKAKVLKKTYQRSQGRLEKILDRMDITKFQRYRTEALLKQINLEVKYLNTRAYKWVKSTIPQSYVQGIDIAAEGLRKMDVTRFVNYDAKIHTSAVNVLADDVAVGMIGANQGMNNEFKKYIRMTQQRVIEDKEISRMIAEGVITGEPRRAVSDEMLRRFRKRMDNSEFITIGGRNYRPDKYAELVARTRTREASSQGTVNTCLRYGNDLIQIDVHGDACLFCQSRAGRVFSITGNHPDFPMLDMKPPYHPNCECNPLPITEEAMTDRGNYEVLKKHSNRPLIPESMARKIPASQITQKVKERFGLMGSMKEFEEMLKSAGKIEKIMPVIPSAVNRMIMSAEKKISNRATERFILFDPSGKEIWSKSGKKNYVSFAPAEGDRFSGRIGTHNHPHSTSFSLDDMKLLVKFNMKEFRAVGKDGTLYTAKMIHRDPANLVKLEKLYNEENKRLYKENIDKIRTGKTTYDQANREHFHKLWNNISEKIGIKYERRTLE